jgi:hypothetical protein
MRNKDLDARNGIIAKGSDGLLGAGGFGPASGKSANRKGRKGFAKDAKKFSFEALSQRNYQHSSAAVRLMQIRL